MISKNYRLKLNKDFERAFKAGRSSYGRFLGVKVVKNDLTFSRFGVILGLKINKSAVARHFLRRRIFNIVKQVKNELPFLADYVIIALPDIKLASAIELEDELKSILFNFSKKKHYD